MSPKTLLCVLPLFLIGCIHKPTANLHAVGAAVGAPPPSQAAVDSCEKTRNWHNGWIMAGTIFGGLAGSGGAADALSKDNGVRTGVGVAVIGTGILAAVSTTGAGITSDTYATEGCAQILQQAANAGSP